MNERKKKILTFSIKLVVSVFLIGLLIMKISWGEIFGYLQKISFLQIILYVAVLLLGMIISSIKWNMLARFKGFKTTIGQCFQLYLTGTFINNFFPSFIGGDTYRSYQIGKMEKRYSAAAASVVMDRITGLIAAMMLSILFALANWQIVSSSRIFSGIVLAIFLVLIGTFGVGLLMKMEIWKKIAKKIPLKIREFLETLEEYYTHKILFAKTMMLGMLFGMIGLAALNYIIFWSLGIQVGILNYLSVIFLISIVSSVPISINNIGVQEWAYVTFFGFFGVSASAVIAVSIVIRILQMIVSFTALPMYLKNKKA